MDSDTATDYPGPGPMPVGAITRLRPRRHHTGHGVTADLECHSMLSVFKFQQKPEGLQPTKRCSCVVVVVFLISGR
eukprot:1380189-Rhodomonas_salina.2